LDNEQTCLIQKCLMNDECISCKVLSNKNDNDSICG
jgi:hypothetical protein